MSSHRSDPVALMLMAFAVVIWSFSWIVMKYMTAWIGPFDLVFWRCLIAFFILLGLQLSVGQRFEVPPLGPTIAVALLQTVGFQVLGQVGLAMGGDAGQVVFLAYTMPFWAAGIAWAVLDERPTRLHMVSFLFAAVGLLLVIAPWKGVGSALALIPGAAAGLCWGAGVVVSKKMFQERPPAMLNFITWQMLLGTVLLLPLVIYAPQPPTIWGVEVFMGLAYMSILASALGWWLWLSVVRRVTVAVVGMSSLGVPALAVVLAWLLLDENPDWATLGGIGCIVLGLIVVNLASLRPQVKRP